MKKIVILLVCSVFSGIINGLLGSGGGIIIVYTLAYLYPEKSPKDAFASALLCILPMSLVSAGRYLENNAFNISELLPYLLPAIIGGIIGGFLLDRLKANAVKKLFSAIIMIGGIVMLVR